MSEQPHQTVRTEWGLRHANGYIRWVDSFEKACDMKADAKIVGRPGDWKNHTLVWRTITTVYSAAQEA